MRTTAYAFDNDAVDALRQHACLAAVLDSFSIDRIAGLDRMDGARCLDVGAGGSAVPVWLADRVGRAGEVVATDIKPRHIPNHSRIKVLTHDITTEPVPTGPFRLIRARLLLMHLLYPERVLRRLAAALPPGGTLVVEDWYLWLDDPVLVAPCARDARLIARFRRLLAEDVLARSGTDPYWASRIHATMRAAGLTDVDTQIFTPVWPAGSPGALLATISLTQFRERFLSLGLTAAELERIRQLVTDPTSGLVLRGHPLFSTMGHKTGLVGGSG
ncbi:methyltransferase domain-containing protein [Micromonospora sp. CPCC 206061]|uniref:methyltransferase domain-containing protein n=1 Tax=Micromonospora sp. CPCC 206061 TaxID=3122410 RepID=UPI002FF2909F